MPTPETAAKKQNWWKYDQVFPENAKCSVMSHTRWRQGGHYRNICKYTVDEPADFAGR